jgi:monofunctional biosynthetic peptidoglycan transglycosylase
LKKIVKLIIFILIVSAFVYLLVMYLSLPDVVYLANKNPKTTALIQARLEEASQHNQKLIIHQTWISFNKIPDVLKKAIRISEDAGFYQHKGVDFTELRESFKRNLDEGRIVRGGSTITQQLAKNLYLSADRSYIRKLKEYFIAKRLEDTISKNRIFHLYLNIIEFGRGIFGVQAASEYFFNKDVADLNLEECVRLTAVIPRPLTMSPKSDSRWMKWKADWILGKMLKYKYITKDEYDSTVVNFQ